MYSGSMVTSGIQKVCICERKLLEIVRRNFQVEREQQMLMKLWEHTHSDLQRVKDQRNIDTFHQPVENYFF